MDAVPEVAWRKEVWNEFGEFLRAHNLTIFTFPDMENGEIFWLVQQPGTVPVAKGKTLAEAMERLGF